MKKLSFIATLLICQSALALILPERSKNLSLAPITSEDLPSEYDFNGIAKLSNCSGSIIKFAGQRMNTPAILMTNGHCIENEGRGFLKAGEVVVDRNVLFAAKIYNSEGKLIPVLSEKLLYATMTNTDVAYYELNETYEDLENEGIDAFDLDTYMPIVGMNIDIVSGYWDRGYRCSIDGIIFALLEGDWIFTNSLRYSDQGCDTIGGTSGSPVIETGTRKVVGINNTGNRQGGTCTLNNPCEQNEDGEISVMLRSYGQQTYNIYSCLTMDFRIDLEKQDCSMPK